MLQINKINIMGWQPCTHGMRTVPNVRRAEIWGCFLAPPHRKKETRHRKLEFVFLWNCLSLSVSEPFLLLCLCEYFFFKFFFFFSLPYPFFISHSPSLSFSHSNFFSVSFLSLSLLMINKTFINFESLYYLYPWWWQNWTCARTQGWPDKD